MTSPPAIEFLQSLERLMTRRGPGDARAAIGLPEDADRRPPR